MIKIDETALEQLRNAVKESMSPRRFLHTAAVEEMVVRLCQLYCPQHTMQLRAAALLHDITKDRSTEEHIAICEGAGLHVSVAERKSPKMFHAKTGALVIPQKYPQFATPEVIEAVRHHTTGRANMSVEEKIIYLADYIDMSRTFEDCVKLRQFFFDFDFENADQSAKEKHLDDTLIMSYDLTIRGLLEDRKHIDKTTFEARNFLILGE